MPVLQASKMYNVPRTTLRNKLSGKSPSVSTGHCGFESHLGEETETLLVNWLLDSAKMGFPINKEGLLSSVQKIVTQSNIKTPFVNNRPGKRWFYNFLSRHKELSQKTAEYVHRGRGSVTEEKIRNWFTEITELLGDDIGILKYPERVFNMDETCFCLAPKGGLIIGPRGKHVYDERAVSNKENVTTLFAVNAAGNFAPPLTIFKYERIPSAVAKSAPEGWGLGKTESGWMTAESFYEYIANIFLPFLKDLKITFPVIVFLDGHTSHLSLHLSQFCRQNQIILIALYPNSTHILQPLDVAVFKPLKSKWAVHMRNWRIENEGREVQKGDIPKLLSEIIKNPNMLSNIVSGFRATGLYPFCADNVDYTKIIIRRDELNKKQTVNTVVAEHLKYFESKINPILLDQFKLTKRRNHEWEGDTKAHFLYNTWLEIAKESEEGFVTEEDEINQVLQSSPHSNLHSELPEVEPIERPDEYLENQPDEQPSTSSLKRDTVKRNILASLPCQANRQLASPSTSEVQPGERTLLVTPTRSMSQVFKDIITWPKPKNINSRKKVREYTPSVITSDIWVKYYEEKEQTKELKEEAKRKRKEATQLKKKQILETKENRGRKKNKTDIDKNSSTSEDDPEEWAESGSSGDDIDIYQSEEVDLSPPTDITPGNFILAKFVIQGKRIPTVYRYIANVQKKISSDEFEIQCLKSVDDNKTTFCYIENDISIINISDIIAKLPEPELKQEKRKLTTIFPGSVDVFEKL